MRESIFERAKPEGLAYLEAKAEANGKAKAEAEAVAKAKVESKSRKQKQEAKAGPPASRKDDNQKGNGNGKTTATAKTKCGGPRSTALSGRLFGDDNRKGKRQGKGKNRATASGGSILRTREPCGLDKVETVVCVRSFALADRRRGSWRDGG
jgi:hypothetical protein